MSTDYFCEKCRKPCEARLWESGAGSDCCEANLMEAFCPSQPDKCDGCEMRPLTRLEEEEVRRGLYEEREADETPAMRARARWMGDS